MKNNSGNLDRSSDEIADDDTVELVVLDIDQSSFTESEKRAADTAVKKPQSQAFLWLKHMESELDRLQSRWAQIDAELVERDARIADLLIEIEEQDGAFAELARTLDERTAAVAGLEGDIGKLKAELADREAALVASGEQFNASAQELHAAQQAGADLRTSLAAARNEISQLQNSGKRSEAEHGELSRRFAALTQTNHGLLGKIQDLELYIDGRKKDWSEQNAQLAKYRTDLAAMERALKSKDKEGARRDKNKEKLNGKILELEKRCSELVGRRRERDDAYQEIEQKLAQQIHATEQLRTEANRSAESAASALNEASSRNQLIDSLREDVRRRDGAIAELKESVATGQRSLAELAEQQATHTGRIAELEAALQKYTQSLANATAELEEQRHRGAVLDAEIAARNDVVAGLLAGEEKKEREFRETRGELEKVTREREDLAAQLAESKLRLSELEQKDESSSDQLRGLRAELAAQQAEVGRLESELEERRQTMNLLDKNMQRINILGASLQRIDRRDAPASELLPAAALSDQRSDSNVHYIGSAEGAAASKKMFVSLQGEGNLSFALHKQNTTIGRSRRSDIRIEGQFVSRIHARVLTHAIGTIIEDLGSKNGILVNAEPVTRCVLQDGDIVSLGGKLDLRYIELDA
jgi:chromosome segregation ATPase